MSHGRGKFFTLTGAALVIAGVAGCQSELRGALNDLIDDMEAAGADRAVHYRAEIEKLEAEFEKFAVPDESADDADRCPDLPQVPLWGPAEQREAFSAAAARSRACRMLQTRLTRVRETLEAATSADRFARDREALAALTEAELVGMAPLIREEARRVVSIDAQAAAAEWWELHLKVRGEDRDQEP